MQPLLSVILPVYNGRRYIREAVQSILKEEIPSIEILVVDDGSTDSSVEEVEDLKVKVIHLPKNKGQAAAQNIGLINAQGTFVSFLDSDDLVCRNGLRWRLEWLMRNSDETLIAGRMAGVIDKDGKHLGSYKNVLNPQYTTPPTRITQRYLVSGGEFPSQMWNLMFQKKFLLEIGPFDEKLRCAHDNDYFYRILKASSIPFENRPTVYYRVHDSNLSGELSKSGFHYRKSVMAENLLVHLSHGISPRA